MKRHKIVLIDNHRRERAIGMLLELPCDGSMEVILQEKSVKRTLDQNALYWVRVTEISGQAFFNGKKFSKEVWHEYFRQNLMPDMVMKKDGEIVPKWVPMPTGAPVAISTTLLHKKSFAEYLTAVEAFGAGLGVMFSANPLEVYE